MTKQELQAIKQYCDICSTSENIPTYKAYCKICKEKHDLCTMCYKLGHNIPNGKGWE